MATRRAKRIPRGQPLPEEDCDAALLNYITGEGPPAAPAQVTPDQQRDALRAVFEAQVARRQKRRRDVDGRLEEFDNGNEETGESAQDARRRIIAEEIDRARDQQRTELMVEMKKLRQAQAGDDLQALALKLNENPPVRQVGEGIKMQRRSEWLYSVQAMMEERWPVVPGTEPRLCAYDGLLVACGADEFQKYIQRTGRLRAAQQQLFDSGPLCDTIDTALLCLDHQTCRTLGELSFYGTFAFVSSPFLGDPDTEAELQVQVQTRRSGEMTPVVPEWGMWGDFKGRVVCKEFFRVMEVNLTQQGARVGWADVQATFADVLGTTPGGQVTGAGLMEQFDGELATEMLGVLYRVFIGGENNTGVPEAQRMPPIPQANPSGNETYAAIFTTPRGASAKEKARIYVYRALYTSLANTWFLHSPVAPALFSALVQCSDTAGFELRSSLTPEAVVEAMSSTDPNVQLIQKHREVAISIANGKQEEVQRRLQIDLKRRRAQQEEHGIPDGASAARIPPDPQTGRAFRLKTWANASFKNLWKMHKRKIIIFGSVCTIVYVGTGIVVLGSGVLNPANAPVILRTIATMPATAFVTNRAAAEVVQQITEQAAVRAAAAAVGAVPGGQGVLTAIDAVGNATQIFQNGVMTAANATAATAAMAITMARDAAAAAPQEVQDFGGGFVEGLANPVTTIRELMQGGMNEGEPDAVPTQVTPEQLDAMFAVPQTASAAPASAPTASVGGHALDSTQLAMMGERTRAAGSGPAPGAEINPDSTPASVVGETDLARLSAVLRASQQQGWAAAATRRVTSKRAKRPAAGGAVSAVAADLEARLDLLAPRPLASAAASARPRAREPEERPLFCMPEPHAVALRM